MSMLSVTRVTHASVLLDFAGVPILTDPWFSERPGYFRGEPLGIALPDLPKLAGVAVSHGHYDHYDMAAFQAYPDKRVPMAVRLGTGGVAKQYGFKDVKELDTWESTMLGPVKVTAAPARHSVPQNTYILQHAGFTVFFGGDTVLIPELAEVARRFPRIDLALLPVNGLAIRPLFNKKVVMNARDAAELCAILKPRVAVPMHYAFTGGPTRDRFLLYMPDRAETFAQRVAERGLPADVRILSPGETLHVNKQPAKGSPAAVHL